jgi:hypothetical protein
MADSATRTSSKAARRSSGLWDLPASRPYAFWLPAVFVLIVGVVLAVRNYRRELPRPDGPMASSAAVSSDLKLPRLCVSLAIVVVASMMAGFSMAHLLRRPPAGLRTVEEAQRFLPVPVLAVVPTQR